MNCKDAEKMISAFLDNKLNIKHMSQFLEHVEECSECMEELTIQYLVMTGSSLIEEGKSFNLRDALKELMEEAHIKVYRGKILLKISYVLEILTIISVIAILVMVVLL